MSLFRRCFINFSCYVTRQKYVSSLLPTAKVHKIPEQNKVYTFTNESTSHDRYGSSSCQGKTIIEARLQKEDIQQLLNEAEFCRSRRVITPSEICRILDILRKPKSIIVLLFLQNNFKFKNKLNHDNLGRCKFISIMHLYREVKEIKGCSGLQIYFKQQMSSVFMLFLPCFQTIFRCETSKMFRHFVLTTKTTQPRPQVFTVNGSVTCNQAALLTSF